MVLEVEVREGPAPREGHGQEPLHLGHRDVGGNACAFVEAHLPTITPLKGRGFGREGSP